MNKGRNSHFSVSNTTTMDSYQYGLRKQGVIPVLMLFMALLTLPADSSSGVCLLRGRVTTTLEWYGYLLQKTFQQNVSQIQYRISYPLSECCANMLIYYDDQMRTLSQDMSCLQREQLLTTESKQRIPLSVGNGTVGCQEWQPEDGTETMIVCAGERTLKSSSPRTWYIVISKCGSSQPITLNYVFNISGFYGPCEEDPLLKTFIPPKQLEEARTYLKVAIAMGVLAGIAIAATVVFVTLFILSRRQIKQKPKTSNGSVTSSQATMTADIFYVNPSLSDREHSDSQYSRSSSENYYEIIPDRRGFESINTQLAVHGHGSRALNLASLPRETRSRIPSYILQDIPPPSFQTQTLQGPANCGSIVGHHIQCSDPLSNQLVQGSSPYPSAALQHPQMTTRSMPASSQTGSFVGTVTMAITRMPLQNNNTGFTTSANIPQVSNHSSTGNCVSSNEPSLRTQNIQNGGITTSAGGLNSHGANTALKTQASCDHDQITKQNKIQKRMTNGNVRRYTSAKKNHARLLNHSHRVQELETAA